MSARLPACFLSVSFFLSVPVFPVCFFSFLSPKGITYVEFGLKWQQSVGFFLYVHNQYYSSFFRLFEQPYAA
eukprot:m.74902 g.74902  ORF g.74902 m.74902 type:complete len:72 (+) comp13956_c0_seq2:726-941(+)